MPVYDFKCEECGEITEAVVPYEDREQPVSCSNCLGNAYKTWIKMPGTTRASYIDSVKTARADEVRDLKRAANLEVEKSNMRPEERGGINKEIKRLKETK